MIAALKHVEVAARLKAWRERRGSANLLRTSENQVREMDVRADTGSEAVAGTRTHGCGSRSPDENASQSVI